MHIRADREELADAFARASRGTGLRTALPILQGLKCETSDDRLEITGSDTEVTVRTSVAVDVKEQGSFVAPGRLITDVIRKMPDGAVTIRSSDQEVEVSGNGPSYRIRCLSLDEYPTLPKPSLNGAIEIDGATLLEALGQVLVAASNDASRPILTGVLLEDYEDGLRLVATDSYRLAVRNLPGQSIHQSALIPARGLKELARTIASERIRLAIQEREVVFGSDKGTLSLRLIEGTFPNYRQLLPDDHPGLLKIRKGPTLDSIGRCALLADDHIPVRLQVSSEGIRMSVQRSDLGGGGEELEAELTGELDDLEIAFNWRYLQEGLSATRGDEVLIEIKNSTRPSLIRGADDAEFLYLLMPVRI